VTFGEFETKLHGRTIQTLVDRRRPPPAMRDELDLSFRIEGQSVVHKAATSGVVGRNGHR